MLGYLESTQSLGLVLLARTGDGEVAFLGESVHAPPITLRPGQSIGSNRFMLSVAATPYAALEQYADAVGTAQVARTRSIVNGWCSWFYTLDKVSEDEVLRNTAFAAEHLRRVRPRIHPGRRRLPARAWGDWEGNERFPHGMKWLAEKIKAHGFKPGIWIAPYVISEQSDVFRQHPEWLLRRRDGSLQRVGNWDERELARGARRGREALLPRHHASRGGGVVAQPLRDDRSAVGLRDDQDRLRGLVDPRGAELPRSRRSRPPRSIGAGLRSCEPAPATTATSSTAAPATRRWASSTACGSRPTSITATRRPHGSSISRIRRAAPRRPRSATTCMAARGSTTSTTSASTCSASSKRERPRRSSHFRAAT